MGASDSLAQTAVSKPPVAGVAASHCELPAELVEDSGGQPAVAVTWGAASTLATGRSLRAKLPETGELL